MAFLVFSRVVPISGLVAIPGAAVIVGASGVFLVSVSYRTGRYTQLGSVEACHASLQDRRPVATRDLRAPQPPLLSLQSDDFVVVVVF